MMPCDYYDNVAGAYSGRVFGGQLPPFWEKIFNLLGSFKKKNPKFSRPYKKISKLLPRKISG